VRFLLPRIAKAEEGVNAKREAAKRREATELGGLKDRALTLLRHHKTVKTRSPDELFAEIAGKGKEHIDQAAFVGFFEECELPRVEVKKDKPAEQGEKQQDSEVTADKKTDANDDGNKEAAEDAKDEPPVEVETEPVPRIDEGDAVRLFKFFSEEEGHISKDSFLRLIRLFMKVVKDTVITETMEIKDSKTLRRAEVGEVFEVLEGPVTEESTKLPRLKVRAMLDGQEGWVTQAGNKGTTFLEEGGNTFKCVKETILTQSFDIAAQQDPTKKKELTRKLKVGEIVEVVEWPKKEETSGLERMLCRCIVDGCGGWATTVGNSGIKFLEVVV